MALAGRDTSLVGCRVADVVHGPGGQHLLETLEDVRTTGRHARNVLWGARAADGPGGTGRAAFSVSAVPVRRPGGSGGGVVIAGLRVTSPPSRVPGPAGTAGVAPGPGPPGPGVTPDDAIPPGLPVLPGVRLAARCLPARAGPAGGGGWLDALMLPHEVIALMAAAPATGWDGPG